MKGLIGRLREKFRDPNKSFVQRNIEFMTVGSEISMVIAIIVDILIREHIIEILMLAFLLVAIPLSTALCVYYDKIDLCGKIQVLTLTCVVMPVTFLFGGGALGGGIFWTLLTYMYIGIVLSGMWRRVMMIIISIMTVGEYLIYYFATGFVYTHTRAMLCLDAPTSLLLVGLMIYSMFWLDKTLFSEENKKAQEETKRAEMLNRTQNQFFSSMSHEIRTPINSILGLNEIILRDENATDEIRRNASNIQGSGRMLLALVNDILDMSRIEAGMMDIVPVTYHLGDWLSEIINMIWLRAEAKGLRFEVDIDPSLPSELFGDEVRIKQIMVNILNNAVKYTKEGSVSLHMEREQLEEDRVLIVFTVTDTGIGIKRDALPHLFDVFRRVDEEQNRYIEGTGLGLSIVKQLVDLMDGTVSVDSVYTQGSTFKVSLWQGISNAQPLGAVNIANLGSMKKQEHYEAGFTAPEARILIVDDNEMNLEVEKKLLEATGLVIDTAYSGEEALNKTLRYSYDTILMDHLMPEMDGVECVGRIRKQTGGMNVQTPVIVLTANTDSESRELYSRSGFDDYLVKPVSGKQLEEMLVLHLPEEKVRLSEGFDITKREINTAKGYTRRLPILITTSTMCDLPRDLLREMQVEVIPFHVHMEGKVFYDNIEASADELIHYISREGKMLDAEPPLVEDFEQFFADGLKKAHRIIYIALSTSMSKEYERACTAAKAFENVTVINSENLSSATGLLVMAACQLAKKTTSAAHIEEELLTVRKQLRCSLVVASTEYMMHKKLLSEQMHNIMQNLSVHPSLKMSDDQFGLDRVMFGTLKQCYRNFIRHALPKNGHPNKDVAFVTYADVPEDTLVWIEEEIRKRVDFKRIIIQKASATVSLNIGPGTFGIVYMEEDGKNWRFDELLPRISEQTEEEQKIPDTPENIGGERITAADTPEPAAESVEETHWYDGLPGIDAQEALKNCGSEDSMRTVLQIFYQSIPGKSAEIRGFYEAEDWDNYIIKIHALKSSCRLAGATGLADAAQKQENAGKAMDLDYVRAHHEEIMADYDRYRTVLKEICGGMEADSRPEAPAALMEAIYDALRTGTQDMDCDILDEAFSKAEKYALPEADVKKISRLKELYDQFDYEAMQALLDADIEG